MDRFADVELVRRRDWLMYIAVAFPLLNVFGLNPVPVHGPISALLAAWPGLVMIPFSMAWRRWPRRHRGELAVNERELTMDGQPVLQRRKVKKALAFPDGEEHVVRISRRPLSMCDVRVRTTAEAERLLTALGQSERQVTATFRCTFGAPTRMHAVLLGTMSLCVLGVALALFLTRHGILDRLVAPLVVFVPMLLLLGWVFQRSCRVTVGADGIAIRRALRRSRFVPFSAVREVGLDRSTETIAIAGTTAPVVLGCAVGNRRMHGIDAEALGLALHKRIEDARHPSGAPLRLPARTLLQRGSSTRDEWRQRIERLAEEAGSYRASALPADELWNVLVDPQESAEVRAGAALAVRRRLDDEGRARVRVAASTMADAPLRRVFTAVDTGDEEGLEAALEPFAPARSRL